MPTSDQHPGRVEDAASAADRPVARPHRGAAGQARQSRAAPAARHPRRRHQRQGLGRRLPQGDAGGGRQARARLHLAAPGALPRAHRASPAPTARRARSARTSWSSVLRDAQRVNAGDAITHFEITTAAAFLAFAEHPADALILEVGLGGRLDATNVVARPALSVITPISPSTMPTSSATRSPRSPGEKAGILKPGVHRGHLAPARRGAGRHHARAPKPCRAPLVRLGRATTRPSSSAAASSTRAPSGCWTCRCRR